MPAEKTLDYHVHDRSLLLPLYKRFVVDPALPFIPAKVNPNTITHFGHLVNLAGLLSLALSPRAHGGFGYLAAAITLHLYNFCDNADGGHACRTNQCSPMGEFLDHGLDLFNVAYIGVLSAWAIGLPPIPSVALVVAIIGGAATSFWEQAETGTLHLAVLNQIEAIFFLSGILVVTAIWGTDLYSVSLGPVSLRTLLAVLTGVGGSIATLQSVIRVHKSGGSALRFVPFLAFGLAVIVAAATGALTPLIATVVGCVGYIFLGIRSITLRMAGKRPVFEIGVALITLSLIAMSVCRVTLGTLSPWLGLAVACLSLGFLGGLAIMHTWKGLASLSSRT